MLRVFNFAAVAAVAAALQDDMDPTLQLMQNRIRQQAVYEPNIVAQYDAEVAYSLTVLTSNYTFSDLDYSFQQPAIWPAYNHTKRMEWIASCWQSPASAYYNNATILDIAVKLLDWWLINGPNSKQDNWWWWTIGVPITLGITTNVLSDYMLPNQTASANLMLSKANPSGYTACNLIWTCEGTVYRAVLTNNYTLASYALNLSYATIVYAPGTTEGIKEDGSFYQHGAQLYSGGYGMSYAQGIAMFLSWTSGTPLGLDNDDPKVFIFSHLMLDGSLRMIRYSDPSIVPPVNPSGLAPYAIGMFDVSTVGRDISRPYGSNWANQAGVQIEFSAGLIAGVGGPRAAEFEGFGALLNGSFTEATRANLTYGNRVYYMSDYALHSSGSGDYFGNGLGWQASVRMASTRTLRCECINGENKLGLHLSDGVTLLYTHGYEYVDIFPAWDWMRLPGTTVVPYVVPWQCGGGGTTSFVGGASDGTIGSALQDYQAAFNESLTMRKATFFFEDIIVSLGANISTGTVHGVNRAGATVWTGIAQKRMKDSVYTNLSPSSQLPYNINLTYSGNQGVDGTVWWVWEGGVGYVFPDMYASIQSNSAASLRGGDVNAAAASSAAVGYTLHIANYLEQNGTWESIGAESGTVSVPMFTLWLEHAPSSPSTQVTNASYAYYTVPNIDLSTFITLAPTLVGPLTNTSGISVVRNDNDVQAVIHGAAQAMQIGVYPSAITTAGETVSIKGGAAGWNVGLNSHGAFIITADASTSTIEFVAAQPQQVAQPWAVDFTIDRAIVASVEPGGVTCNGKPGPTGATFATVSGSGVSQVSACALQQ